MAAAAPSLPFGRDEEARAETVPTEILADPGRYPAWTASASSSSARMVSEVGTPVAGSQPCST